jgi:uncharacterized protein
MGKSTYFEMKILKRLTFLLIFPILGYSELINNLTPYGYVSDFAGIIDKEIEEKLNNVLTELEEKTTAEVAVVTIKSLEGETIENFAVKLFEKWGIGKKGKNNGVLFLTSLNDRKTRIEVGYGLEGILPDGKCGEILDKYVIPYFKQGDYSKGVMLGTLEIASIIAKDAHVELTGIKIPETKKLKNRFLQLTFKKLLELIFFLFIIIFWYIFFGRRYVSNGFSTGFGGYGVRIGRFSSGGFSGGFGGFGGGISGGGGASRGW